MNHLFDIIMEVLGYLLPWRAWLCMILAVIVALALSSRGVALIWPFDIVILAAVIGIVVGFIWEERVG